MTILEFKRPDPKPEPDGQTAMGPAFCLQCSHTWTGTAPTGTVQLECPECKKWKAATCWRLQIFCM